MGQREERKEKPSTRRRWELMTSFAFCCFKIDLTRRHRCARRRAGQFDDVFVWTGNKNMIVFSCVICRSSSGPWIAGGVPRPIDVCPRQAAPHGYRTRHPHLQIEALSSPFRYYFFRSIGVIDSRCTCYSCVHLSVFFPLYFPMKTMCAPKQKKNEKKKPYIYCVMQRAWNKKKKTVKLEKIGTSRHA